MPPAGTVNDQLRPAPLSTNTLQTQLSGNGSPVFIALQSAEYLASR